MERHPMMVAHKTVLLKWQYFSNWCTDSMQYLSKSQAGLFGEIGKLILKFKRKWKTPVIAETILKKNKVGGLTILNIKTYYKARVIKTLWYWHKERDIYQWNGIEIPEMNTYIYGKQTVDKGAKIIGWAN